MVQSVTGDPLVGRSLGPYLLEDRLGAGGMGTVYRAVHRELCQTRAIKVLQTGSANDPSFLERFRREARLAAGLRHPNIVTIYDFGEQDGEYYVAMEYLAGRPLNDVLRSSGPLPPDRAIGMLEQLADALDYAHAQGLVHRDVKPANVMVEPNGHLTLLDFGISRAVDGTRMTRTGLIMGTIAYMAPELLTTGVDGPSVDQYALGVVAYEMLTGRVPFEGTNTPAVIYAQAHTPPPPPRTFRAGLPLALEGSILRQLSKYPDERYPSGRAFVAALRAAVWPTPAPPPSLVAPEPPPTTRRQDPGPHASQPAGEQATNVRSTASTAPSAATRGSTAATRSTTASTVPGPIGWSVPRDTPAVTRPLLDEPAVASLWRQMALAGFRVGAGVISVVQFLGSPFVGDIEPGLQLPRAFLLDCLRSPPSG